MSITDETLQILLDAARAQNEYVGKQTAYDRRHFAAPQSGEPKGGRPGDHFNARADWGEWLSKWGWVHVGGRYWKRPGKSGPGISATVGYCKNESGTPLLYVFSSNANPLEAETAYSLFSAYAIVEHDGDFSAAASALAEHGFGEQSAGPQFTFTSSGMVGDSPQPEVVPPRPGMRVAEWPKKASELCFLESHDLWYWHGCIGRGVLTLLSALPKVGKTTLIAHLLRSFEDGKPFVGQATKASRILYVTEESEHRWAGRVQKLGLKDHIEFWCNPFAFTPTQRDWTTFLDHVAKLKVERSYDVIVFDPIVNLWPVKDENDAPGVLAAMRPLRGMVEQGCGLLLIHHLRKSDGAEATGSRGSNALTGFVDTILELRRCRSEGPRSRTLKGHGRYEETPDELILELDATGTNYRLMGSAGDVRSLTLRNRIIASLPISKPGMTVSQIKERLDNELGAIPTGHETLRDELKDGARDGYWNQDGGRGAGSTAYYYRSPDGPQPPFTFLPPREKKGERSEEAPPKDTNGVHIHATPEKNMTELDFKIMGPELLHLLDDEGQMSVESMARTTGYALEDLAACLEWLVGENKVRKLDYPGQEVYITERQR